MALINKNLKFLLIFLFCFWADLFAESLKSDIQKDTQNIALLSANAVYHLNKEELPNILRSFLSSNKNVKALYIEENLEGERLLSFFKDTEGRLVFNEEIPQRFKKFSSFESKINYKKQTIGKVVVFYSSELEFSPKEQQWIKKGEKLNYYHNQNLEPFEWKNKDGRYMGIFPDIMKLVSEQSGIRFNSYDFEKFNYSFCNISSNIPDMDQRLVTILVESKSNKSYFNFTKNNILRLPAVLIENENSSNIYLDNTNDLKNKRVAVIKNSILKGYLKKKFPHIKLLEVNSIDEGFNLLKSESVDFFTMNSAMAQYLIKMKKNKEFKIYRKLDFIFEYKIAVSKKLPEQVVSILDKSLENISDEQKSEIFYKWISVQIKKEIDWVLLRNIALFFITVMLLVIIWNIKLKRTVESKTSELKKLNESLEDIVQKEIEKKQQIQEQLFRSEKLASMGEMIGNIAHQWRQPLSVISTLATSVKLQKEIDILEDKELLKSCDIINENAQYLSNTIDDFRNFIKGEKSAEVFLLKDLFKSCDNLIRSTLKNNHITIIYDLEQSVEIKAYKNELLQCCLNFINNSKDALMEDKNEKLPRKYIFIESFIKDDKVYIVFKDNGGGIPESIKNRVFDPYFTTKHQSQGTGLGLHMVYNIIVNGMGGELKVENVNFEYKNENYKGASFTVILKK